MDEKIKSYKMMDGYVAIKPQEKNELAPENGRFAIHTFGTVISSTKAGEIGLEVIYDGSKGITLEGSDIEVVPEEAVLGFKEANNG